MPADQSLQKVMVIGSGPIVIGQAAEFDYAGTQACRALREEGLTVILVNSNPATIMTDANIADRVYIEPLTAEFVTRILRQERPDALLPTLGGQVGLNLARELAKSGVLAELGVQLLGTPLTAIEKAEDRELFKEMLESIGEPVPESLVAESLDEALAFADKTGFPLIVRPAYTLGGTGGGVAHNREELAAIVVKGLKYSVINQVLVERSVAGWKEIEFEVMRDRADNCITICSMENIDPMGIHTGDSIVVAPAQTLTDREYQMLRQASLKIIRALGIQGGCNIQFALNPESFEYTVIEVNPRVSRSSALASKATGYPIAKVAVKIAIGKTLDEIKNAVTGKTFACFEPALDYVVVKIPRWPFDKFAAAARTLGTQMKATGEVMAIDRSFEPALLKAVRCLEMNVNSLWHEEIAAFTAEQLSRILAEADDRRLFALAEAFRRGWDLAEIHRLTKINPFFLQKIKNIINLEKELQLSPAQPLTKIPPELLYRAKAMGFVDAELARLWQVPETLVREYRLSLGIRPVYKMVDTCAAEFEAETPYFYSTYDQEDEAIPSEQQKVVVLGSGPIRIGQGIEFDYCSVHSVWALRQAGYEAIIINNNPETVSTDFDTADRLYFEPLVAEDVIHILEKEKPTGVIVQFGGQTAINLAGPLENAGFTILGTTVEDIDRAEDRDRFDQILIELGIAKPPGHTATSVEGALTVARKTGYPVLVRPSYVLGGRAMEIVYNDQELVGYMTSAVRVNPNYPVLVDKYLFGKELEVDAIADGEQVLIPGIMAHVERAGVHSGDSIAVYPAHNLPRRVVDTIVDYTTRLALHLKIRGVLNIQYVLHDDQVFVLEVNPRSSRTVPYLSKITGVPMIAIATNVILGKTLAEQGYRGGLLPATRYVAVKVPVFSFAKLLEVETSLGPEMKSTGEVMGVDQDFHKAFFKAIVAAGMEIPHQGTILATIADKDKAEALPLLQEFAAMGYRLAATAGTAQALQAAGVPVMRVNKIDEGSPHLVDLVQDDKVQLIINTLTKGKQPQRDGFRIRRAAVEHAVPCLTSLDTTRVILQTLRLRQQGEDFTLVPLQEYLA